MKAIPTCIAFAAMAGTVLAQAEQRRSDCEARRTPAISRESAAARRSLARCSCTMAKRPRRPKNSEDYRAAGEASCFASSNGCRGMKLAIDVPEAEVRH